MPVGFVESSEAGVWVLTETGSRIRSWDRLVMILMYMIPILVMFVEVMGPSLDMTDTKLLT